MGLGCSSGASVSLAWETLGARCLVLLGLTAESCCGVGCGWCGDFEINKNQKELPRSGKALTLSVGKGTSLPVRQSRAALSMATRCMLREKNLVHGFGGVL